MVASPTVDSSVVKLASDDPERREVVSHSLMTSTSRTGEFMSVELLERSIASTELR